MKGKKRGGRLFEGGRYKVSAAIGEQFKRKTLRAHRIGNNGNGKTVILLTDSALVES